jgi:hypothetical protein
MTIPTTTTKNAKNSKGTMTPTKRPTKATKLKSTPTPQVSPAPASPPAPTQPATPPDPNAALEQYVQQTVSDLDTVEVSLGADPALSPAQKRHAAKLRKGGAAILSQIGNLATQQQLESPALQVSDMTVSLGKAQALQPLANRLAAFSKHVSDVIFMSQSSALVIGQQFYALLQRRAKADVELAAALAPVKTFFARRPVAREPGELTKPQKKATNKAMKTVKKNAPELLAPTPTAAPEPAAQTTATPTAASPASAATATAHS